MSRLSAVFGQSRAPRADMALALSIGAFAALILWEADKIPPPFFDPLGSAAVPNGVALVLAVLAGLTFIRAIAALPWPARPPAVGYRLRPDIAVAISVAAVLYVAAMDFDILGFRTATIAFVAFASAVLARFQMRMSLIGVLVALGVGIGGAYIFTQFFFIALP